MNKEFYNKVKAIVEDVVAVGGSTALAAHSLETTQRKPGDLDLLLSNEADMIRVGEMLQEAGYELIYSFPSNSMFDLRAQFKLGTEKYDFFIVPGLKNLTRMYNGVHYVRPEVVWAARGYYASKGLPKAANQLVDAGFVLAPTTSQQNDTTYGPATNTYKAVSKLMSFNEWLRAGKPNVYGAAPYSKPKPNTYRYGAAASTQADLAVIAGRSDCAYKVGAYCEPAYKGRIIGWNMETTGKLEDVLHAEIHLIQRAAAAGISLRGTTVYCTLSPCAACEAALKAAGVKEVRYVNEYKFNPNFDKNFCKPL